MVVNDICIICKWFHSEFIAPNDVSGTFGSFPWCPATSAASTTCTNFGSVSAGRPTRGITGGWSGRMVPTTAPAAWVRSCFGSTGLERFGGGWYWKSWWKHHPMVEEVILGKQLGIGVECWRCGTFLLMEKKQGGVMWYVCFGVFSAAISRNLKWFWKYEGVHWTGAFKGTILESQRWKNII